MADFDGTERLLKLVRDKIPEAYGSHTYEAKFAIIPQEELLKELHKKLLEEVGEYLAEPSKAELADVIEVIRALASHELMMPFEDVIDEADQKHIERGGFTLGMGMYGDKISDRHG